LLLGDRKGYHSIQVSGKWRLVFLWKDDGPHEVEFTDYH
jgi:proteic killer suppression protein